MGKNKGSTLHIVQCASVDGAANIMPIIAKSILRTREYGARQLLDKK
jgi:hypothetical protein